MYVRFIKELGQGDVGIYTYRTPDEAGNEIDVNLGIYSSYVSSKQYWCRIVHFDFIVR